MLPLLKPPRTGSSVSSTALFLASGFLQVAFARTFSPPSAAARRSSAIMSSSVPPPDAEYGYLEEVLGDRSLAFAKAANERTLSSLGDPSTSPRYGEILKILESNDRIPHVSRYGNDEEGRDVLYNFWKDGTNPRGIYRRTNLSSYRSDDPEWETVVDVDALGAAENKSWVFKGVTVLPRRRDRLCADSGRDLPTRALMKLSDGGADAVTLREFDYVTGKFLGEDDPDAFHVAFESKIRASYKSRDVLLVGTDVGEDALTDSGYPRTVREWNRGTKIEDAPIVFRGEKSDVSAGMYISDQRIRGGGVYEFQYRSKTFYTSTYSVRKIENGHLLKLGDPDRIDAGPEPEFVTLDVPEDAGVAMYKDLALLSLRTDWTVDGTTYTAGSLLSVRYDQLITGSVGCSYDVVFEPDENTSLEGYSCTKNYLILNTISSVKSRLIFLRVRDDKFEMEGADAAPTIRSVSCSPLDAESSDAFWLTTSSFGQPPALYLADAERCGAGVGDSGPLPESPYVTDRVKSLPDQYDASDLEVSQRFATSKDGTKVPYFLLCKKGVKLDGNTPTLLYGYGGFEISLTPGYKAAAGKTWIERGGAYVEANIRGGGEFGPAWHQAALKENRNKAFEDFVAVGEDLCQYGLCSPATLGCRGGSNGGLLVGMMLVTRPDLFGAVHCAVPLLDMRRFHTLLAGASWAAEYGSGEEDWEKFLSKYSPYHLIDEKKEYPPVIFTTSTRDDRVHPAHARKMVKKLEDVGGGRWPVYYYENMEGGHGGAADSKQQAFMNTLATDFLWDTLSREGNAGDD